MMAGMSDRLRHRVVVVTGASGIAAAGARRFAREGAAVFVVSRDPGGCEALAADIAAAGGRIAWAAADLRDEAATVAAVGRARERFGRIDGLFAVAGGSGRRFGDGPLHEMTVEGWSETLAINGLPAFLASREVVRAMLELPAEPPTAGGSIVIVTSVIVSDPVPSLFATHAYAAIKGAEDALALTMAAYYAPYGIRVNTIAPGSVATPMSARAAADPPTSAYVVAKQPLAAGFLPPESVADAALFLLSDEARHITGQRIAVDGGWGVTEVDGRS
jgi:NAD(P)-dependent dehydrogenase (short-subunit alcohol dehydrogenase family)